jgi:hypothetical protein
MWKNLIIVMLGTLCLQAVDPKVGDTRDDVVKLLGEPNGKVPLRDGGAIYSYPRGDVYFDSRKVTKVDIISEEEFKIKNEQFLIIFVSHC